MNLGDYLGLAVVVIAAPLNWYVAWKLWRLASSSPRVRVLRERAVVAVGAAIVVTIFGLIFLNNDAELPPFDTGATRVITRLAMFLSVVPALYWLRLYRSTKP
jgi:hypothetical protein